LNLNFNLTDSYFSTRAAAAAADKIVRANSECQTQNWFGCTKSGQWWFGTG